MATTTTTAALNGVSLTHARLAAPKQLTPATLKTPCMSHHNAWMASQFKSLRMSVRAMVTPETNQVEKSIKEAEEACASDPVSGECAAAWDEVEEVSAAASDKRQKEKETDPLDAYCKDNPETDECRTYDN